MDQIPTADIRLQNRGLVRELRAAFERVLLEDDAILGAALTDFEQVFSRWVGVSYTVGVGNGTDALILALRAAGVGVAEGDEVLVPSNSYPAAVLAVLSVGATPILVEPTPAEHCIDPGAAAEAITERTRAIVPVHTFGLPADMGRLRELATEHDLRIVEDAAAAHGAQFAGARVGSLGDVACFSFHPRKTLGAIGDAGAVTTDSAEIAARLRGLRDFGRGPKGVWGERAWNTRMDTLQAALLRVKLAHVDGWILKRREIAERYQAAFDGLTIGLPVETEERRHGWTQYVIRIDAARRGGLRAALSESGVQTAAPYPALAHLQPAFAELGWRAGCCPMAEELASESLSLPIYPGMSDAQQDQVVESVRKALGG